MKPASIAVVVKGIFEGFQGFDTDTEVLAYVEGLKAGARFFDGQVDTFGRGQLGDFELHFPEAFRVAEKQFNWWGWG